MIGANVGAPKSNNNALRNGTRRRLTLGELPREMRHVRDATRSYRRELESAVIERHGSITLQQAHEVDAAAGFAMHGAVCRWLLCNRFGEMTHSDLLNASREVAKAREARNRIVRLLKLDQSTGSVIDSLYAEPINETESITEEL